MDDVGKIIFVTNGIVGIAYEINKIKWHHSSDIRELLGYIAKSEVVHKDDMVEL